MAAQHHRTIANPTTIHPPASPTYSHIASYPISATHKLVTIAGQCGIAVDNNGTQSIPPDFRAQMQLALANLDRCLEHAGVSRGEIMRLGVFIVGDGPDAGRDIVRKEVLGRWFSDAEGGKGVQPPPDTLLYVPSLAHEALLFEIDCMAVAKI